MDHFKSKYATITYPNSYSSQPPAFSSTLNTQQRIEAIAARRNRIANRSKVFQTKFNQVNKRSAAIQARFEQIEKRNAAIQARFEQIEKRNAAIQARFNSTIQTQHKNQTKKKIELIEKYTREFKDNQTKTTSKFDFMDDLKNQAKSLVTSFLNSDIAKNAFRFIQEQASKALIAISKTFQVITDYANSCIKKHLSIQEEKKLLSHALYLVKNGDIEKFHKITTSDLKLHRAQTSELYIVLSEKNWMFSNNPIQEVRSHVRYIFNKSNDISRSYKKSDARQAEIVFQKTNISNRFNQNQNQNQKPDIADLRKILANVPIDVARFIALKKIEGLTEQEVMYNLSISKKEYNRIRKKFQRWRDKKKLTFPEFSMANI